MQECVKTVVKSQFLSLWFEVRSFQFKWTIAKHSKNHTRELCFDFCSNGCSRDTCSKYHPKFSSNGGCLEKNRDVHSNSRSNSIQMGLQLGAQFERECVAMSGSNRKVWSRL